MHSGMPHWVLIMDGSILSAIVAEFFAVSFDGPVRRRLSHAPGADGLQGHLRSG
jgi:hypothetical protein